jgi:hypothetical protein
MISKAGLLWGKSVEFEILPNKWTVVEILQNPILCDRRFVPWIAFGRSICRIVCHNVISNWLNPSDTEFNKDQQGEALIFPALRICWWHAETFIIFVQYNIWFSNLAVLDHARIACILWTINKRPLTNDWSGLFQNMTDRHLIWHLKDEDRSCRSSCPFSRFDDFCEPSGWFRVYSFPDAISRIGNLRNVGFIPEVHRFFLIVMTFFWSHPPEYEIDKQCVRMTEISEKTNNKMYKSQNQVKNTKNKPLMIFLRCS